MVSRHARASVRAMTFSQNNPGGGAPQARRQTRFSELRARNERHARVVALLRAKREAGKGRLRRDTTARAREGREAPAQYSS
jgi:hypothetical protein